MKNPKTAWVALEALESRVLLTAQMVHDVNSEDVGINPSLLTSFRDEIYFAANSGDTPEAEIWKSDGTVAGTQFVASLGFGKVVRMKALDEHLIVVTEIAGDHLDSTFGLFASDGTQEGTVQLERAIDSNNARAQSLSEIVIAGDRAYVRTGALVDDDTENIHAVYSTDGTLLGTRGNTEFASFQPPQELPRLPDSNEVDLGAMATYHPNALRSILAPATTPRDLTLVGDRLFFSASGENFGTELWQIDRDGKSQLVVDLNPGSGSSGPTQLAQQNGNLVFLADDGDGLGVWALPNGSSSPQRLADADEATELVVATNSILFSSASENQNSLKISRIDESLEVSVAGTIPAEHDNLTWFDDSLVYTHQTANGHVLERVGTEAVSVMIGGEPNEFFAHGDLLVFTSTSGNGRELWTFDGNAAVELDMPFRSGSITTEFEGPGYFSVVTTELESNGKALIGFVEGAARELTAFEFGTLDARVTTLVTDGTPEGTHQLNPRKISSWSGISYEVDGEIFLWDSWQQWWSLESNANAWSVSSFAALEAADDRFDFIDFDPVTRESYVLTFEGESATQRAERIRIEPTGQDFPLVQTSHGEYFLRSRDQSDIHWADIPIEPEPYAELLVRRNGTVEPVFTAEQLLGLGITSMPHNRNLFAGTTQGRLFAANDLIYFVAGTEEFGRELWQSDGTAEGTKMVKDIFPGPRSSNAELLGVSGNTLFFMANDGVHGQEVWSINADEALADQSLLGDLDDDGEVNFADFLAFSQDFGKTSQRDDPLPSDLNGNGQVDFADFLLFSANFGQKS